MKTVELNGQGESVEIEYYGSWVEDATLWRLLDTYSVTTIYGVTLLAPDIRETACNTIMVRAFNA